MSLHLSDGRPVPGKLVLALQRCIVDTLFNDARWSELGYATDTTEIIENTYRLRRSMSWNDDDYPERVFNAIEGIIAQANPPVLDDVVEFVGLKGWLAENDAELFAQLYVDLTHDGIEELATDPRIDTVPELLRHARRIRSGLESDPELAIGSAKELLETVMKTVLIDPSSKDDVPTLVKRTRAALGLNGTGSDQLKRIVSNLSQVVVGVAELRNAAGTGHGRTGTAEPSPPRARLAVDCAVAASRFILDMNKQTVSPSAASTTLQNSPGGSSFDIAARSQRVSRRQARP